MLTFINIIIICYKFVQESRLYSFVPKALQSIVFTNKRILELIKIQTRSHSISEWLTYMYLRTHFFLAYRRPAVPSMDKINDKERRARDRERATGRSDRKNTVARSNEVFQWIWKWRARNPGQIYLTSWIYLPRVDLGPPQGGSADGVGWTERPESPSQQITYRGSRHRRGPHSFYPQPPRILRLAADP